MPVLEDIRARRAGGRGVAALVLIALLTQLAPPAAARPAPADAHAAASAPVADVPVRDSIPDADSPGAGSTLARAWRVFRSLRDDAPRAAVLKRTAALRAVLSGRNRRALRGFAAAREYIRSKRLGPRFERRRRTALERYRRRMDGALGALQRLDAAATPALRRRALHAARSRLVALLERRAARPPRLAHTLLRPIPANLPKTNIRAFRHAGLEDNPVQRLADAAPFAFDALPGADDPAYLAPTAEVTLSPDVAAKAAALGHDPVRIYDWVHDHIQWLPTWGATQDADLTLHSGRGNAMDIASLTIALLRSSGIPARYVHGTIDVPATAFRNWAGGFGVTAAAADLAASGGIPITDVISGGTIAKVRLEHVWVEAAIDYEPSRGAVNRAADSWVSLDPAFKQYETVQGVDAADIAALDPQGLTGVLDTAAHDAAGDTVQGVDLAALDTAYGNAVSALQAYAAADLPDTVTAVDVLGGRRIIPRAAPGLPPTLPNHVVVAGARYARLPAALEHRIAFSFGDALGGTLTDPVAFPWAAVNNHRITLSFRPATPDDARALQALLPAGPLSDPGQLPASLPSFLFHVVPELKLDGEVVLSGPPAMLGDEVPFSYAVTMRGRGTDVYPKRIVAGSFLAIAAIGGGVDASRMRTVGSRLTAMGAALAAAGDGAGFAVDREALLGRLFYAGVLGYFAQYSTLSELLARRQGARHLLGPSTGSYGYEPRVRYVAGIPMAIGAGGAVLDVDRVAHVIGTDPLDVGRRRLINMQCGAVSSTLERTVPEQMFGSAEQPVQAVSAVRALVIANAQAQSLYYLTAANQADMLPDIRHSTATLVEIKAALAVGKDVITHASPISVPGWTGAGYIIMDPVTGDAAYKIGGGFNGGVVALQRLMSPVFTFWETWDITAAGNVATGFARVLNTTGSYLSIAAVGIDAFRSCGDYKRMLIFLSVFAALTSTLSRLVASLALSPLGGILMGLLVGQVVSEVLAGVKQTVCAPRAVGV